MTTQQPDHEEDKQGGQSVGTQDFHQTGAPTKAKSDKKENERDLADKSSS
ncbi:hypothetical protein [Streptomyces sp. NPDC005438]